MINTRQSSSRTLRSILLVALALIASSTLPCKAVAETLDASWVHGGSAHLEDPSQAAMNRFGWGSVLTFPDGASTHAGAWVHFAIPTPTIEDGVPSRLQRVLISHDGDARIDHIDIWDGPRWLDSMPVAITGDHLDLAKLTIVPVSGLPAILYGVGISLHVSPACGIDFCPSRTMRFSAVGADFSN